MPPWRRSEGRRALRLRRSGIPPGWRAACLVVLFLTAAGRAFAAKPGAEEILRRVGKVYSRLGSYHLAAERVTTLRGANGRVKRHTRIVLDAAPRGQARLALSGDGPNVVIVSDGETAWQYAPRTQEYAEGPAAELALGPGERAEGDRANQLLGRTESRLVARFVGLWNFADHAALEGSGKVKFQGRKIPCYRVLLLMNGQRDEFWISQASFLVLRERLKEGGRGRSAPSSTEEIRIREFDFRVPPSAELFKFTPPAGARRVAALDLGGLREGVEGAAAGDFTLRDVQGKRVRLRDFRGKTVLLDFWATWCPACRKALPALEKECEQHPQEMVLLAVDDESKETIQNFLNGRHDRFTALVDRKRKLFRQFDVRYLPTLFVISPEGVIIHRVVGWEGSQDLLPAGKGGER
jgi:peroxiredoxin/outer membrane lipoprotein-sorting protein